MVEIVAAELHISVACDVVEEVRKVRCGLSIPEPSVGERKRIDHHRTLTCAVSSPVPPTWQVARRGGGLRGGGEGHGARQVVYRCRRSQSPERTCRVPAAGATGGRDRSNTSSIASGIDALPPVFSRN